MSENINSKRWAARISAGLLVLAAVVAFCGLSRQSQVAQADSVAVPEVTTDLGNGFSAQVIGTTAQVKQPCAAGSVVTYGKFNPTPGTLPIIEEITLGTATADGLTFTPSLGLVYRLGCGDGNKFSAAKAATSCVAFSSPTGAIAADPISLTIVPCPIDTYNGLTVTRPDVQLPVKVGAKNVLDGVGVQFANSCRFGNTLVAMLDGKVVAQSAVSQYEGGATPDFTLPLLTAGEHKVTTTCTYADPRYPNPAQLGACMAITVANNAITAVRECQAGYRLSSQEQFQIYPTDATNTSYEMQGACGGFGFSAQTAKADAVTLSLFSTWTQGSGDVGKVTALPTVDPEMYIGAQCYGDNINVAVPRTGEAAITAAPTTTLMCYQVAMSADKVAYLNPVTCPFTMLHGPVLL